ncbi:hypothetical protein W97_06818 [Coniosporium apollinis CBS 100218]|uniref:Helicase C-terminal domain-containing protein n=1 Tax=Coniosporium apollinis (strain CBS 100218) TaxID=1168221 RepID=R7Z0F5_CONA1|nr:uncharacterized protein W97_06818 [Coniosporium apollinis CBS 100218]EON67675.1 hypothetical protein W97_06818 [Coniosporium apollinis CBS 100218]
MEVTKKWIAGKISEGIQIQLLGLLEKDTAAFCKELWNLYLSAQSNPQDVPKELLEAKKLELIQEKIAADKAANEREREQTGAAAAAAIDADHTEEIETPICRSSGMARRPRLALTGSKVELMDAFRPKVRKNGNIKWLRELTEEVRPEDKKFHRLLESLGELYDKDDDARTLIFVDRQKAADQLLGELMRKSYQCRSIHGGIDQIDRNSAIDDFKKGEFPTMIATSVAARGLDVKQLKLVVNHDAPNHLEDYVHRAGRRAEIDAQGGDAVGLTKENPVQGLGWGSAAPVQMISLQRGILTPS